MGPDLNLFSLDSDLGALLRANKQFKGWHPAPGAPKMSISVLANFSTQFLVQSLDLSLKNAGFHPSIHEGAFDQWEFELINPQSATNIRSVDFLLLALSSTKLILNPQAKDCAAFAKRLRVLLATYQQRSSSKILLLLPEHLEEAAESTSPFFRWVEELRSRLQEELQGIATFISLDPLIREFGSARWFSKKFLINSKFSCHPNCYPHVGNYLAKQLMALVRPPIKLIAVDLDNTLWGGVVGDVGAEGVDLSADSTGYSHLLLQRYLLGLKEAGVLLALISKNDFETAQEVFEGRPEMLLKLSDFVRCEINWQPKSENLRKILADLNLTSSGIAFLDDSKFEREEVRNAFPEVIVPELAESPEGWCSQLAASGHFTVAAGKGSADLDKTEQYLVEELRKKEADSYSNYGDFLGSLELVLEAQRINSGNIERVVELIHKTNQFNLRTQRLSASELRSALERDNAFGYCYRLQDKFGDYGIISVFIAHQLSADNGEWEIANWLMSCRAMGRRVEDAVFAHFLSHRREGEIIRGEYIPTAKNKPIADLLQRMNFQGESDQKQFIVGKSEMPIVGAIKISTDP